MLPNDFPKWELVYYYFRVWKEPDKNGISTLDRILSKLVILQSHFFMNISTLLDYKVSISFFVLPLAIETLAKTEVVADFFKIASLHQHYNLDKVRKTRRYEVIYA